MKRIITIITIILSAISVSAQEITEEQKQIVRDRVAQKVEEFGKSLSRMVDTDQTKAVRDDSQRLILSLFIGKGEPYEIYDYKLNRNKKSKGVKIQTSSANRSLISTTLLRDYLNKYYDPITGKSRMKYSEMKIETADAIRVDNITREGDHYVCVAYFYQDFYGIVDGVVKYSDRTYKKIKCRITQIEIPGGGGVLFDAKLGDISVVSTSRL